MQIHEVNELIALSFEDKPEVPEDLRNPLDDAFDPDLSEGFHWILVHRPNKHWVPAVDYTKEATSLKLLYNFDDWAMISRKEPIVCQFQAGGEAFDFGYMPYSICAAYLKLRVGIQLNKITND